MEQIAAEISRLVETAAAQLHSLPESQLSARPAPGKWSKKEIVGHLTDSAHNNLRRFVCGQYQDAPNIVYHQDEWVALQHYQDYRTADLLELWVAVNRHLGHVLRHLPEASFTRVCNTGKDAPELHSLRWLAEDYVHHLRHHLAQAGVPAAF